MVRPTTSYFVEDFFRFANVDPLRSPSGAAVENTRSDPDVHRGKTNNKNLKGVRSHPSRDKNKKDFFQSRGCFPESSPRSGIGANYGRIETGTLWLWRRSESR